MADENKQLFTLPSEQADFGGMAGGTYTDAGGVKRTADGLAVVNKEPDNTMYHMSADPIAPNETTEEVGGPNPNVEPGTGGLGETDGGTGGGGTTGGTTGDGTTTGGDRASGGASEGDEQALAGFRDPYADLATKRAGVDPVDQPGYVKSQEHPDVAAGSSFITPESTVAGQLANILNKDSQLSRVTDAGSRARAEALGMLSTSDYIGAGQRALTQEALKIATPDALAAKEFQQQEQAAKNEQVKIETEAQVAGDLNIQKAKIEEQTKKLDDEWALSLKGVDSEVAAKMENLKGDWQVKFKEQEQALARELTQLELDAQAETTIMNQAHQMMNDYQQSIQFLLADESFRTDMAEAGPGAMEALFNDMFATTTANIEFSAKAAGVYDEEFQAYLDELIEDAAW